MVQSEGISSTVPRTQVGLARRSSIAQGHHGQGSAHAEERDRVGESVPVHEGQYRPVRLLSRERRGTMLGIRKGGRGGKDASSSPPRGPAGLLSHTEFI